MNGKTKSVWYLLGLLPAVWLGLLVAPAASGGLFKIIRQFPAAMQHPFHIIWCEDSGTAVLFFVAAYGLLVGAVLSTRRNYRRGVEHGSAKWGSPERLNRKYCAKPPEPNKVFTQHIRMGLDGRKHRRNLNTVVVGGSGAGKTRCYAKPCLYEACLSPKGPSFVCLDPKGELLRDSGGLLRESGYDVRVLDLLHMEKSHCYNPFVYLTNDNEVQMLVTNLFKATTPKGAQSQDPFWDSTASILLSALVYYLYHEAPPEEQNFPMVMEMLRAGEVREDDDSYLSPLDVLFERIYEDNVAGKISDERFSRMAQKYEQEQGEVTAKIKALRKELRKEGGQTMTAELFLDTIRQYTDVRELTQRMVTELIDHIDVYHAEKVDGVTRQRVVIHYHFIGAFIAPKREDIPEAVILMQTRKGVAVCYSPEQIAS